MDEKQNQIKDIFDGISDKYDFFNKAATFFFDSYWRNQVVNAIDLVSNRKILDLCTGTGEIALKIARKKEFNARSKVIGLDFSANMLKRAEKKVKKHMLRDSIEFVLGNVDGLPFKEDSFDYITVGFSVRNFSNIDKSLYEMKRVLKKEGKIIILETAIPSFFLLRWIHRGYFEFVVPFMGWLISRKYYPYCYFKNSVIDFLKSNQVIEKLKKAGFSETNYRPLTGGVVGIYKCTKC